MNAAIANPVNDFQRPRVAQPRYQRPGAMAADKSPCESVHSLKAAHGSPSLNWDARGLTSGRQYQRASGERRKQAPRDTCETKSGVTAGRDRRYRCGTGAYPGWPTSLRTGGAGSTPATANPQWGLEYRCGNPVTPGGSLPPGTFTRDDDENGSGNSQVPGRIEEGCGQSMRLRRHGSRSSVLRRRKDDGGCH